MGQQGNGMMGSGRKGNFTGFQQFPFDVAVGLLGGKA
jgi:hypothetical protein